MWRAPLAFVLLALLASGLPFSTFAEDPSLPPEESLPAETETPPLETVPPTPEELQEEIPEPETEEILEQTLPLVEELQKLLTETTEEPLVSFMSEAMSTLFEGIGQTVGDALSDHMASDEWYLGQTNIQFTSPGFVHHIVVFPDIDDPDFIDCKDTVYGTNTLNIWLGRGTTPAEAMTHHFTPLEREPREDGGCLYTNDEGVFVYPGTEFQFLLNNGYGPAIEFDYLGAEHEADASLGQAKISDSHKPAHLLVWKQSSETISSLKFLIPLGSETPPLFGTPLDSTYIFHGVDISFADIASRVVLADGMHETPLGFGFPLSLPALNSPHYFKESGTLEYVRVKLSSYYERANTLLSFRLGGRDCVTLEKYLFEWGIYDGGRNIYGNEVIIGPFSGSECDFNALDPENPQNTVRYIEAVANGQPFGLGAGDNQQGIIDITLYSNEETGPKVSNVLFLPGIKGSRLYVDENGNERKLWEPNGDDDVPELFLNEDGASLRSDVYVKPGGVIDDIALNLMNIYDSFLKDMDELQMEGTLNDFEAVPYDWRLSLSDNVNNGTERAGRIFYNEASSTPYIEQTLRELAVSSKTGKVTIVAHSNGGLVTKALLQKLGDTETMALVDKIIFVAVPQSGAPQALGALLFGQREQLPTQTWLPSFILSQETARAFAEHSPMGYHLLPSQAYFDAVREDYDHPVARFVSGYQEETIAYDGVIGTFDELARYLRAEDGGRTKPSGSDLHTANVLRSNLIAYAEQTHTALDSWVPPNGVELYQIAGWGEDTISGVEFYEECSRSGCKEKYRPIFTEDGDGVVPVPSALAIAIQNHISRIWTNLRSSNKDHGNILEFTPFRNFLIDLISGNENFSDSVSNQQPVSSTEKRLRFILHSPLSLELHGDQGGVTGETENTLDGAVYGEFGEVKYIIAPAGQKYTLVMNGTGTGTFSLDIQEALGDEVISTATIANVPTTNETTASLTVENGLIDSSSLQVDLDGDAQIDFEISPEEYKTVVYEGPVANEHRSNSSTGSLKKPQTDADQPSPARPEEPPPSSITAVETGEVLGAFYEPVTSTSTSPASGVATASSSSAVQDNGKGLMAVLYTFIQWLLALFGIHI